MLFSMFGNTCSRLLCCIFWESLELSLRKSRRICSVEEFQGTSFSLDFQNFISLLIRLPFFLSDLSDSSWARDSIDSLLFSPYELPTSLERLARLDRLPALTGRVRRGTAAENDADRSPRGRVPPLEENRGCGPLIIVEALLVKDGTSSVESHCAGSPGLEELHVVLSVMDELAVCKRGTSKEPFMKSGEETDDVVSV